ncbi:hypothetical protein BGZ57DRAFT_851534 [Hyaloscypha finlandica]|nr:hypothetical protein BGZ57DRAFT_851534 [Hyaloscypha finlandica]
MSRTPKASSPTKPSQSPIIENSLNENKGCRRALLAVFFVVPMATVSPNRTGKEAAYWINWLGWSGFNGAKGFSRDELKMLGQCLSTEAASKKGFISNEIDFFSVKPEFLSSSLSINSDSIAFNRWGSGDKPSVAI